MIPSSLAIGGTVLLIAFGFNRLFPADIRWFNRQRRPRWLTFEGAIPWIWISIFICGAWSAYGVWEAQPHTLQTWWVMGGYIVLEATILAYTPIMTQWRSLVMGTVVGGVGFIWGAILSCFVFPISSSAGMLLLPFLLWSPIGTWVTWQMSRLNPSAR